MATSLLLLFSLLFLSPLLSLSSPSIHPTISSACSSTPFPSLCSSSLSSLLSPPASLSSQADVILHKDVIHGAVILSLAAVNRAVRHIDRLTSSIAGNVTARSSLALSDCVELLRDTADELREADVALTAYNESATPAKLAKATSDLKTLLSAAVTNERSCMDGFSHDVADKAVRERVKGVVLKVSRHCRNVLALICDLKGHDIKAKEENKSRKLLGAFEVDDAGFPEWMTESDRRLLQGAAVPDVVVAADGTGNFRTVSAAVAAAPSKSRKRYVIRIKAGTYTENVDVPRSKTNLMFIGDGIGVTIITGSRNVVDGSTTFHSATVAIVGGGFLGRDLTIENSAGPSKHQAVAMRVGSDLAAFYRCEFRAYQDTLYVHSLRQFFRDCTISGTIDFIFGNSAVVIQNSNIVARRPNPNQRNLVTAQGREDPNQNTGIVIQKCTINGAPDLPSSTRTYLGRPWREYSRTVVMQSTISSVVDPAGWFEWSGNFALDTLTYREYQNTGPGAGTTRRVTWRGFKVMTSASEAQIYTVGDFIGGQNWLGPTGIPFSLGL